MRRSRLLAAFLNGVALPSTLHTAHHFTRLRGSDLDRLRSDMTRVGGYFHDVIARENGNYKKVSGAAAYTVSERRQTTGEAY